MNNLTKKSKFLCLILRHDPSKIGIDMDSNGWVLVKDLCRLMPIKISELHEIVSTDEKNRYSFSEDKMKIRANQGHSIDVDLQLDLKQPPDVLWHGTAIKNISPILKDGLKPMSRKYVHLSQEKQTAIQVGSRHGKVFLLNVHAGKMYSDGYEFWISKNNVWLVKFVPAQYLEAEFI